MGRAPFQKVQNNSVDFVSALDHEEMSSVRERDKSSIGELCCQESAILDGNDAIGFAGHNEHRHGELMQSGFAVEIQWRHKLAEVRIARLGVAAHRRGDPRDLFGVFG
jgi:hypothetical protein